MTTATITEEPQVDEEEPQVETPSFASLVREYEGLTTSRAIAQALWDGHGVSLFEMLPESWVVSLLAERVRVHVGGVRNNSFHVEAVGKDQPGVSRMAVDGDYWSVCWIVNGQFVETRDLNVDQINWLIGEYRQERIELKGKILFLTACAKLARKHRAKTLGDLKRKGVELPSVEFREENGI